MKYYKAGVKIAKRLEELKTHEDNLISQGLRISRKIGASRTVIFYSRGMCGDLMVSGFKFSDPQKVDENLFKRAKKTEGCWELRASTKAGRKLISTMRAMQGNHFSEICKAIGMQQFSGFSMRIPGISKHGEQWYLMLPDEVKAKGCIRISDIQYEKARDAK